MKLKFSRQIFEKYSNIKICPMGAEIFHSDGKTAMTNLIVVFRNFTNAPENCEFFAQSAFT